MRSTICPTKFYQRPWNLTWSKVSSNGKTLTEVTGFWRPLVMPWNGSDLIYPPMLHGNGIFTCIKSINLAEMEVNLPYMEHQGMHALDGLVFGKIPKLLEDDFDFLMDFFDFLLFEVFKEIVIICDDSILLRAGDFCMCSFNGIWKWVCNENIYEKPWLLKNHIAFVWS